VAGCCEHGNEPFGSIKGEEFLDCQLPAFRVVEVPLTVDNPAERTVEVDSDGHSPAVALDVQSRDVCVVVVMLMVQWCQRVDGRWVRV